MAAAQQVSYTDEGQSVAEPDKKEEEENMIDLEPDKNYGWYDYTFNAKNKYFVHIQWKINPSSGSWKKYGVRRCTINGKSAEIVYFDNNPNDNSNNEYVSLQQGDRTFHLYYIPKIGWCLDTGKGVIIKIGKKNNGKIVEED